MRVFNNTLIIVIIAVALGASLFGRSGNPWNSLLLNSYAQAVSGTRSSDAIYVALDDKSIAEFGGWPWPRNIHAQLLEGMSSASVVVYDIAFVGASSSPSNDAKFEQAAKASNNLVLPLLAERNPATGELITIKPFGNLPSYAMLGHVDMPVENGTHLQTIYLKAGNANAQHPLLAYAAGIVISPQPLSLQGARPEHERRERAGIWARDYANILVPRVDIAKITTITARSILRGEVDPSVFVGRPVFVGIDTASLTQKLNLSGFDRRPYSDAEIQIQIFEAIVQGDLITPASSFWVLLCTLAAVILTVLLIGSQGSRWRNTVLYFALVMVLFVLPLLSAEMGFWVSQGYGLLASVLLLGHYFISKADFFHRQIIPVNEYPSSYWHSRWKPHFDSAISEQQAVAVCVVELDYFERFKLDYSRGHVTNSYYRVRAALEQKLGKSSKLLAFEHYQENRWVMLLSAANTEILNRLIQQLSTTVEAMQISHQNSSAASVVTTSVGAGIITDNASRDLVWLLGNADVALMQAIAQGRNHCVVIQ